MPAANSGPTDARCIDCDRKMVTQRQWDATRRFEREEMVEDGYTRQGANGRCSRDYHRLLKAQGTI